MNMKAIIVGSIGVLLLVLPAVLVLSWMAAADERLESVEATASESPKVAVAAAANEKYCTGHLQKVLRRVLQSCGLLDAAGGRGCQPLEAKNVATMSGDDFNALFLPMSKRGGIIQFEKDSAELDAADRALIDKLYADRRGASYFFVVSRASPEGAIEHNRELSRQRAETVMSYLRSSFNDPDLDKQVGLLWLGAEYAQLDQETFCSWERSAEACKPEDLNRSAFITWIDCRL